MSGKRMILTLPWSSSSEELQEPGNACRELEIKDKECTGQKVFEQDPAKYNRVVEMLREQLPVRHISKTAQMSFSTISAIRRHSGLSVETQKEALTDTIRTAARVVAERVLELGEQMSPRDASVSLGILTDKLATLQGEPCFISVNRSEQVLTHQEWNRMIAALPTAKAYVIDSTESAEGSQ
jgi:uncharacterized protein YerC